MTSAAIVVAAEKASWSDVAVALLPWGEDLTLIEFHIEQLQAAGVRDIEVVLGYDAERVIPLVSGDNVEPIANATWAADRASSLRTGASALVRGTTSSLVIDVAEPRPASILRALVDAHVVDSADATLPTFEGTRGTPVVIGEGGLAALRNVHGDADVWSIVERFSDATREVSFDSGVVLMRIDSRETYEQARLLLATR